jgi:membrane protein
MNSIARLTRFITTDIWRIRADSLTLSQSLIIKPLRVAVLAVRGFDENKCSLKASALTFYTLMSIVPVAAMAFGIAKGFGFEAKLQQQLMGKLQGQEEVIRRIIEFAHKLLEDTKGGLVAGVGIVVLFWTVIKLLGNIEGSFNDIWGIQKSRSIARKFSDYLSAMLLCPLLFIIAGSLNVAISGKVAIATRHIEVLRTVGPFIQTGLKLLPYVFVWILFTFVYVFMPNTKVRITSGIVGGIVAGTVFQLVQWAYIAFQVGIAKSNAIYGGFAALPLFLIWLQTSWLIVFFGAEISFAHQHARSYEFEPDCLQASYSFKELLALRITHLLIQNFQEGRPAMTTDDIESRIETPVRLVQQVLDNLVACGIISEISGRDDKTVAYQPAKNIDLLTIGYVTEALKQHGSDNLPLTSSPELEAIANQMQSLRQELAQSSHNILLKDVRITEKRG